MVYSRPGQNTFKIVFQIQIQILFKNWYLNTNTNTFFKKVFVFQIQVFVFSKLENTNTF